MRRRVAGKLVRSKCFVAFVSHRLAEYDGKSEGGFEFFFFFFAAVKRTKACVEVTFSSTERRIDTRAAERP